MLETRINTNCLSTKHNKYVLNQKLKCSDDVSVSKPFKGQSWPWSYGCWIYNYLCNQCLSPLMLWVRIPMRARCTTLGNKVCQSLATGRWFSPGPLVSSINQTYHDITEILLKVTLNTITPKHTVTFLPFIYLFIYFLFIYLLLLFIFLFIFFFFFFFFLCEIRFVPSENEICVPMLWVRNT